jgi:phosphatidylethanolamine-binding protein (PEBP) family uncharacterized protein
MTSEGLIIETANGYPVEPNIIIDSAELKDPFNIFWNAEEDKMYTIFMVDLDAPYPSNPSKSPLVHLFILNIIGSDIKTGFNIVSYQPPSPPADSPPHRYLVP